MSSTPNLYSTPAFEVFRRALQTPTIQRFRGLNAYTTLAQLGPDWAQDLLNVIVSGSGGLSKMRLPMKLTPNIGKNTGPNSFWDFQQANGTRQVLAFFGNDLYYFTNDLATQNFVETNALNAGPWSMVTANNILFGANGQRMMKWTGANWQNWGIQPGATPPAVQQTAFSGNSLTGALFDGATGYVSTLLQLASTATFTWEIWFKTNSATAQALVSFENTQTGGGATQFTPTLFLNPSGQLQFGQFDSPSNSLRLVGTSGAYKDNAWHQAVVTSNAGVVTLYIDGSAVAGSGGVLATTGAFNGWWRIGYAVGNSFWPFSPSAFFNGLLSHASYWTTSLSAAQIANHYNTFVASGQAAYETTILADAPKYAWWLTEAAGTVAADSADGNTGTYQGTVTLNQNAAIVGGLSPLTGYEYAYSYKNSVTGHVGTASPASATTGAYANKANVAIAAAPNPADGQIDTLVWFRTLDGGGDLFRLAEVNLATGALTTFAPGSQLTPQSVSGLYLKITDASVDTAMDQTTRAPLINNPPIQGKYTALGQSRVFVFNLVGAPQDIIYSGYEQILLGRPEESFPPNNRLRLSIGAEAVAGGGVLQSGVVAFSQTGRMYMLRGQVEDITLAQPVNFSAFLEELPWTLGCLSHFTIQATPYGLVWLAGDKTLQLFDGRNEPVDIGVGIYPLLRQITPGTESQCVAGYFNWLERDMYVLLACVNGSLTINRMFCLAVNKQPESDQIESIEAFISDIPANLAGASPFIGVISTSKLQRMLCLASQGFIQQLPVSSDTQGGLTQDLTIIPATNGNLNAYWRSGYFGNESPARSKLFRWTRMISDQDPLTFKQMIRLVDDEQRTFLQPEIIGPTQLASSRFPVNRRAKRASVEIDFPAIDAPANVIELGMHYIGTSDR